MSHTPRGTVRDDPAGVGIAQNELVSYSGDQVAMYTHCGTHIDTLNHFGYHNEIWNGYHVDDYLGSRHWRVCGAERIPPIMARGVLLDITRLHGVDMLPPSYGIGRRDIEDAEHRQGVSVSPGDVVFIRTGRMTVWPDPDAFMTNEPGLNREGAEYLARAGAVLIGADNLGVEQLPSADPENWQVVHTFLFAEAGVPIMEVVDLEEVAREGLSEFAFLGAPLRLRGATAGPIRPMALPLRL